MKAPKPEDYLTTRDEETTVMARVSKELKNSFEKALKYKKMSQTEFIRCQMQWLIDFVEFEKKNKKKR